MTHALIFLLGMMLGCIIGVLAVCLVVNVHLSSGHRNPYALDEGLKRWQ